MRLLILPRVLRVKRGAENAFERFDELQKEVKKSLICWKSSILTRSLNLVRFEFWDLSRNRKGRVSAVKSSDFCSELGKSFVFKFRFLSFLACLPFARALLSTCALLPPHTHSRLCHLLIYSLTSLISLILLLLFSFCYYCVCLPFPLL